MGASNGTNNDTESSVKMDNTIPTYVVVRTKNYKNVVTAQEMLKHGKKQIARIETLEQKLQSNNSGNESLLLSI